MKRGQTLTIAGLPFLFLRLSAMQGASQSGAGCGQLLLVLGTHFATPSAGKIVKKDDSFRFVLA